MTAVPGVIQFDGFNIGDIDLTNPNQVQFNYLDAYEDIMRPVHTAEVQVLDYNDVLGQNKLSGKEPVNLNFSVPGAGSASFDLALFQNKMLDDKTTESSGSGKYKTYSLRMASSDILKNRSQRLSKSFNQPTHQTVQDAWSTITDSQVNTPDPTNGNQRIISNNQTVFDFLSGIHDRHVSQQYQSSLYTLFAGRDGGQENRNFATFEHLMSQGSIANFTQNSTMGGEMGGPDAMNNMLWFHAPQSFNTPYRWNSASNEGKYNIATGKWQGNTNPDIQFTVLGGPTMSGQEKGQIYGVPDNQKPYRHTHIDPHNDKSKTGIAQARTNRANFLKDLSQNSAKFEINGNPNISVGKIVNLNIPNKSSASNGDETQINGPVLITRIRHRIKPFGTSPRYTMVIEGIKAAFDQGVS